MPKITHLKEQVDRQGNPLYENAPGCWVEGCGNTMRWQVTMEGVGRQVICDEHKRAYTGEDPPEPDKIKADL